MKDVLRDAATLIEDGVKHALDVPGILRQAAKTIDDLRSRPKSTMFPTAEQHEIYQQNRTIRAAMEGTTR